MPPVRQWHGGRSTLQHPAWDTQGVATTQFNFDAFTVEDRTEGFDETLAL